VLALFSKGRAIMDKEAAILRRDLWHVETGRGASTAGSWARRILATPSNVSADLTLAWHFSADFAYANSAGSSFDGADFERANFAKTSFESVTMERTKLKHARLRRWTVSGGKLRGRLLLKLGGAPRLAHAGGTWERDPATGK
jgi:Pentapeptide repeats (8 copies)